MNRRSLASRPAERNIPLARQSPCSAAPDTTPSTAGATLVPTQTHPTWTTAKTPSSCSFAGPGHFPVRNCFPSSSFCEDSPLSPACSSNSSPQSCAAIPASLRFRCFQRDFLSRLSGQDHLCQLLVDFGRDGNPHPCPWHCSLLPAPLRADAERLPRRSFLGSSAQPWAVSQSLGRDAAGPERGGQSRSGWNDLREYYGKGNCWDRERLPEINTGPRQQPQTRLSLRTLRNTIIKNPYFCLNNPPSGAFLPLDNPPEGGGAGGLEGSNPFVHSWDAWHCSEPQLPARPLPLRFAFYGSPSRAASPGRMQENT